MPDSSDQTIRRLQQENKKLKKTLEQKGKELDLERGLWKTRQDINIPVDADRAALLHRLETLDGIVSDEALLHAATLHSKEEFEYILERFEEAIIKSEDAPLFRNNEMRSDDPGNRCNLYPRHAFLMCLLRLKDNPTQGTRSGRLPRISGETLKAVKKKVKKAVYLTAEDLRDTIRDGSGIGCMTEYTISYARFLLRSWGFTKKVPVGRHVKRASRQKIAWFRKKLGPLIEERMRADYTACVQDEVICVADARLRKGVYTPKEVRGVYTYTGSHSKTIVFGLITIDGEGFFQRYGFFTGKEFVEFLKAACERFGKILMMTDGAPQHRSKFVRGEIGRLYGMELQFLPPGCPDLNAIEEVWCQTKHAILDVPYVRLSSMCSDIDKWLRLSLPKLDIERYLYRKA